MGILLVGIVVLAGLEVVHIRGLLYQQQSMARLTERVEQLRAAMALLTDTTETGTMVPSSAKTVVIPTFRPITPTAITS
jgi:hypothetical protein